LVDRANPVLIAVARGTRVESRHCGAAVVTDSRGRIVAAWGDVQQTIYPRSAVKPLQVLAWLEIGKLETAGDAEIAVAAASHHGEPFHLACVIAWLARLHLSEADLICGPHPPLSEEAAHQLMRAGELPRRSHNNCSGKHAGFLAACRALDLPVAGYGDVDHPVQVRVRQLLSEMGGTTVHATDAAVDGCGVPTFALPLQAVALAFARLSRPEELPSHRAAAANRLLAAIAAEPRMLSGSAGFDSRVVAVSQGTVIAKTGAEGVYAAVLRDAGLGIAVKIDDGASRAARAVIAALIRRFAAGPAPLVDLLEEAVHCPLRNTQGVVVGSLYPVAEGLH
jgi:L-asparaginase II